jgi:hypothetical protein
MMHHIRRTLLIQPRRNQTENEQIKNYERRRVVHSLDDVDARATISNSPRPFSGKSRLLKQVLTKLHLFQLLLMLRFRAAGRLYDMSITKLPLSAKTSTHRKVRIYVYNHQTYFHSYSRPMIIWHSGNFSLPRCVGNWRCILTLGHRPTGRGDLSEVLVSRVSLLLTVTVMVPWLFALGFSGDHHLVVAWCYHSHMPPKRTGTEVQLWPYTVIFARHTQPWQRQAVQRALRSATCARDQELKNPISAVSAFNLAINHRIKAQSHARNVCTFPKSYSSPTHFTIYFVHSSILLNHLTSSKHYAQ